MLQSIYIHNYALIDTLEISFEKGFSVITGETGAGKSIILGAIGLLLGQRADTKSIKNETSRCIIEARFDISAYRMESFFIKNELEYEKECILRRELQASGKSRAFINDTPAPLAIMKELGEKLIDIHSQHQNQLLNNESFQLNVVDVLAHDEKELLAYLATYDHYRNICKELEHKTEQAAQSRADEDYIHFQLQQLDEMKLQEGEQEALEQESGTLSHAEEIKAGLYNVENILLSDDNSLLAALKDCLSTLRNLQKVYQPAQEFSARLESSYIDLKDLAQELNNVQEEVEFNPERLAYVNERLNLIYSLEQKHRVNSTEELLALATKYRMKLNEITSSDEQIDELNRQKVTVFNKVKQLAEILTVKRRESAKKIQEQMQIRLAPLGMPHVRFAVELTPRKEPDANGADNIAFLFSANKNGNLQNITTVASGGEIARVMLSLKALIAGEIELPTIIFDEIDTGVSGEIADKMAAIMEEMGHHMQVISITHLPQIASRGSKHYKVYKQDSEVSTSSHIRLLDQEERIEEIAHMLSGATLTDAAVNNAIELLSGLHK